MSELLSTTPQEKQPEQAPQQNHELQLAKTVEAMERLHATEIFGTPKKSKEFLDSLDYDEFKKYIDFVHGTELDIPADERGKVSNSHVGSEGGLWGTEVTYRPPHRKHRDPLLKEAFEKSQSIEDPEMAGLTLGLSINAVHYFDDGNGRTARMAYALLSKGYDGSPEDQEYYSSLLENVKGRKVVDVNPTSSGIDKKIRSEMLESVKEKNGYAEMFGEKMPTQVYEGYPDASADEYSPQTLGVADDIDTQGRQMLYETMESGGMTMISLMKAFPPERVKEYVNTSENGEHTSIDGNRFLPTLSQDEIFHWWITSQKALGAYVKKLIHVSDREDAADIAAHYSNT